MNAVVPSAKQMLENYGEFFPYGAAMKLSGEIVPLASYAGDKQPLSQDVIDALKASSHAGAASGQYQATAVVYDVSVSKPGADEKTDAVAVALDHQDHYSVIIYLPYTIKDGRVEFGPLFMEKGEHAVFKQ
jgi:hypothetical protein